MLSAYGLQVECCTIRKIHDLKCRIFSEEVNTTYVCVMAQVELKLTTSQLHSDKMRTETLLYLLTINSTAQVDFRMPTFLIHTHVKLDPLLWSHHTTRGHDLNNNFTSILKNIDQVSLQEVNMRKVRFP